MCLIETRHAGYGQGYVKGEATMYPDEKGVPEIVLHDMTQLSDSPPRTETRREVRREFRGRKP